MSFNDAVTISGSDFGTDPDKLGTVELNTQADGGGTSATQVTGSWVSGSIDITVVQGAVPTGSVYLIVSRSDAGLGDVASPGTTIRLQSWPVRLEDPIYDSLTTVAWPTEPSMPGPFKGGSAYYGTFINDQTSGDFLLMMQATSSLTTKGSWSNVDDKVGTSGSAIQALWSVQHQNIIHIVTQQADGTPNNRVAYHAFDVKTDEWLISDEEVATSSLSTATPGCTIGVRSTEEIVVAYTTRNTGIRTSILYAIRAAGGGWTTDVVVADGPADAVNYLNPVIVKGGDDRMHISFQDSTNDYAYQRTLRSDDTLETFPSPWDTGPKTSNYIIGQGISYVQGSVTKVRCPNRQPGFGGPSSLAAKVAEFDSADTPTVATSSWFLTHGLNQGSWAMATDGVNEYLPFRSPPTLYDLYYMKDADTNTLVADGNSGLNVSANVFEGPDLAEARLAMFWDDSPGVRYSSTLVSPPKLNALSSGSLPVRNYYCPPFYSGSAYYTILVNTGSFYVTAMRAGSNPETDISWSNDGGTSEPMEFAEDVYIGNSLDPIESMWVKEHDNAYHVATQQVSGRVAYHVFSPGIQGGLWTTRDEHVSWGELNWVPTIPATSIEIRSTGVVVIGYARTVIV